MKPTTVSIIIVHYKAKKELFDCLKSILKSNTRVAYEIIVVDNDEEKEIEQELKRKFKEVRYIKNSRNNGYGGGLNLGAKFATGSLLFFLNPDTLIQDKTVDVLSDYLIRNIKTGIVAPILYDTQGNLFSAQGSSELTPVTGVVAFSFINRWFPNNPISRKYFLKDWDKKSVREVNVVPGTAFMIKREAFKEVGGFDEHFFLYFEESDICKRVKNLGYQIYMLPGAKIQHLWEMSTNKSDKNIRRIFLESRLYYFRKHFGFFSSLVVDLFLRIDRYSILLVVMVFISGFLRLYKISDFMMFIGDFARDYLAARDMLLTGKIPLVGITSSVTWLHQGPMSIYLIALALALGNFHPVAPAIFYGILSVGATILVYVFGSNLCGRKIGILAGFFYATSPLIVINARMPYHTSLIPLFALIFYLLVYKFLQGNRNVLFFLFISFGLLLQVELSNGVVAVILAILWFLYKFSFSKREYIKIIGGFLIGTLPFLLYDLSHHFIQTFGLPLWIINRTRLFLGLTVSKNSTIARVPGAIKTVWEQFEGVIFPYSPVVVTLIVIFFILVLIAKKNRYLAKQSKGAVLLFLSLLIPIIGFVVHAAPGTAYFPLLFPSISIAIGILFYELGKYSKFFILLFFILMLINTILLFKNDFYLGTKEANRIFPPGKYNFGVTWKVFDKEANIIIKDSHNKSFVIQEEGILKKYATSVDNYKYVIWWKKREQPLKPNLIYQIYASFDHIPVIERPIYRDKFITVIKHEIK